MEQYISKSALVAEIERRKKAIVDDNGNLGFKDCQKAFNEIDELKKFIDTLEVKEVDLNKEIANQYEANYEEYLTYEEFADIAKHFFELGMAVSNKQIEEKKNIDSLEEKCNTVYKDITMIDRDGNKIKARMEQREKV